MLGVFRNTLVLIIALPFIAWAALALWLDGPEARWAAGLLVSALGIGALVIIFRVRPFARAAMFLLLLPVPVLAWWLTLTPSNERDWLPDVAHLPSATLEGSRLTLRNVRNFHYRSDTDFDEVWETRTHDLDQIVGYDMFLSFWGPTLYGHTISSWEFADGSTLAISIETRKETGEGYSAVRGLFRQYELYYVVADERDVVGLRTNHRGERVYLYRVRGGPEKAREGLLDMVETINELAEEAAWYNALTTNCTTSIWYHAKRINPQKVWDWRILVNGYLEERGYENGAINRTLPFEELRAKSEITERAKAAGTAADFSRQIREGLPARPPPRTDD